MNKQGELFCGAQDSGLSELIRILSARHKLNSQVISFENDGYNHQTLANICTQIDIEQLEFWKNSDVAYVDGKTRKMPKMMERKGNPFAPLFWLMNVLDLKPDSDNYLKFWRKNISEILLVVGLMTPISERVVELVKGLLPNVDRRILATLSGLALAPLLWWVLCDGTLFLVL
ncbi:MAG: hypothetical protein R2883_03430 [Caldisericia bacterium]